MTEVTDSAVPPAPRDGLRLLHVAATLFIVIGLATFVATALSQWALSIPATPDTFGGPGIGIALVSAAVAIVAGLAQLIAFICLFAWKPGWRQLVFWAPALGIVLRVAGRSWSDTTNEVFALVVGALTILAGVVVYRERMFLRGPSLVVLLALIVSVLPLVAELLWPTIPGLGYVLSYVAGASFAVCGVVTLGGVRAKRRMIGEGGTEL